MSINFFNTYVDRSASSRVLEVLETTFLSEGALVKEFEKKLSTDLHIKNVVAVNSGTTALHLALVMANIGEGDEVILSPQTFIATGLVILQQKATPVFADIEYETGNISIKSIKEKITPRTKAIIVVHWAGYPVDLDEINEIAGQNKLVVIEDAAHALGATYKNKNIGEISDYTCFSFQAIKHLTTGDGGAVACKNSQKYDEAIVRRWFGIDRNNSLPSILGERQYDLNLLGFKYHLNDFAASLGLANMISFHERLKKRIEIANYYTEHLSVISDISLFKYKKDRESSYWLFGLHVPNRERFITSLKLKGIPTSVVHQRIDKYSIFGGVDLSLINQNKFDETQIHIPIHDAITYENAKYIVQQIKNIYQ